MNKAKRRVVIAGNWKMNKNRAEAKALITELLPLVKEAGCEVVICTPYTNLETALALTEGSNVKVGAENCHWAESGAFTGEISAQMLKELGVQYVIIGHSERRQYFGETDETVAKRVRAALESGLPVKLNCVPQAGVNEGELEQLAALAKDNALQVRFIEMMPIGYGAAMPCISGPELRARFARRWPELAPLSAAQEHALGDGPAVYYTVPGWQGSIGFIAAVHGKFCASCNRVRLTSQGFLRPCLASETGCDLRALLRSGADDAQLLAAIRETIWAKPREHHFNDSSMPATRGMYRIGG